MKNKNILIYLLLTFTPWRYFFRRMKPPEENFISAEWSVHRTHIVKRKRINCFWKKSTSSQRTCFSLNMLISVVLFLYRSWNGENSHFNGAQPRRINEMLISWSGSFKRAFLSLLCLFARTTAIPIDLNIILDQQREDFLSIEEY